MQQQLKRSGIAAAAVGGLGLAFAAGMALGGPASPGAVPNPRTSPSGQPLGHDTIALVNADLQPAGSCDDLLKWYVDHGIARVTPWGWEWARVYAMEDSGGFPQPAPGDAVSSAGSASTTPSTSSTTGTNVQEAGVDEPDTVKTDGRLLVRVLDDRTLVVYDVTGPEPVRLGSLSLTGLDAPELLLSGDRVVVIGQDADSSEGRIGPGTRVLVVDVADPASPTVVQETAYDSSLVTARLHGDAIRLVVSVGLPSLDFVEPGLLRSEGSALKRNQEIVKASTLDDWMPHVTTVEADGTTATDELVDCGDVNIPAADAGLGTIAVVGFDAASAGDEAAQDPDVTAVATQSEIAYFSADHLYLATAAYRGGWEQCCWDVPSMPTTGDDGTTYLYGFDLDGTATTYAASGEVDGQIADRWSMDEYDGVLRVAVGPTTRTGNFNSIVTLTQQADDLAEIGRVDKLGENEQIMSMRWFDGMAVMVTFRQVDPFYAVDLTDPEQPRLLGSLKIPGFSSYLHPLGSHRMLGMGSAADPMTGQTSGAKAALFDVSDVTQPRELDTVSYAADATAQAALDPRQFTWLPDQRTALTVISEGYDGRTGYVSVLHIDDSRVTNEMVEVEYGVEVDDVRLVPLADGRVVLVTGDDVSFFEV